MRKYSFEFECSKVLQDTQNEKQIINMKILAILSAIVFAAIAIANPVRADNGIQHEDNKV
jgi:hypothetical protein